MLKRMKVGVKLLVMGCAFTLPIAMLLFLMVKGIHYDITFAQLEKYGNVYQRPLEDLLRFLPEHQWLAQRYASGEQAVQDALARTQSHIDTAFAALEEVDRQVGTALQFTVDGLGKRKREHVRVQNVKREWHTLKARLGSLSPEASVEQHRHLVADVRTMITHSGDTSNLILDPDLDSYYLMDITLLALPQTQDRLASIIAYGMEVLQRPGLSAQEQLQFAVYAAQLREADFDRVVASTETALNEDQNFYGRSESLQAQVPPALQAYREATETFIKLLSQLAASATVDVQPDAYLAAATRAREASFTLWHTAATELDRLLDTRMAQYRHSRTWALLLTALAVTISTLCGLLMARSISRPLAGMVATARRLATGDVTQRVEYQGSDEIGQLAAALNTMAAHLRQMLTQVRDTTAALNTVSGDLTTASAQLAQRVDAMGDTTTATASKANDMSTNMTVAAATTEQATSNVRLIATATEEMIATVNEIAQNAEKSRQVTAAAVESVHTACGRVDELGQAAQEISLVTDVIMEIAEQTKLLALNATIEAARAGEAGKGFAVVANEVKALATQTNAATEDIRQKVEAMQRSTDSTVREITQIQQVMSDVNDLVASIASAVEEQAITTRDIAGNTGQAVTGLHAMVQTVTAATAVAGEMAGEMGTVHASSRELEATSDQLKQQATTLTQIGQALHNVVETFHL